MHNETIKRIHMVYGWVSAVLIVMTAAMLIAGCIGIYLQGGNPFTPESVGKALSDIAVIGWITAFVVLGGLILPLVFPMEGSKLVADRDTLHLLNRYWKKVEELPESEKAKVLLLRKARNIRSGAVGAFAGMMALIPIRAFTDPSNFEGANLVLPLSGLLPGILVLALAYMINSRNLSSIHNEIEIFKANGIKPGKAPETKVLSHKTIAAVRIAVFSAAVVLIVLGIGNSGFKDVLGKAIRICTECIGLG